MYDTHQPVGYASDATSSRASESGEQPTDRDMFERAGRRKKKVAADSRTTQRPTCSMNAQASVSVLYEAAALTGKQYRKAVAEKKAQLAVIEEERRRR